MKNKKLFAILTLVCFMFTLMPVAAFAADEALTYTQKADDVYATIAMGDADYVVYSYDGSTEKNWGKAASGGEFAINVTNFSTNGSGYIALVENNGDADATNDVKVVTEYVTTAMVNNYTAAAASGAKADVSALIAKDGNQSITDKKAEQNGVKFVLTALDANRDASTFAKKTLYIWAKDAAGNITSALNMPTGFTTSAIEGVYVSNQDFADKAEMTLKFARSGEFTVYAGYAAEATGGNVINVIDELSEIKVLSAADASTIKVTSASANPEDYTAQLNSAVDKVVDSVLGSMAIVPNNVMSDKQYVTIYDEDGKALVGATVTLSTNSGSIELNKETAVTNGLGQIDFKVSGSVEGTYEIEVSVEGVSWIIEVQVGNTNATYIELANQPTAPQALYGNLYNKVRFNITDINGNVVKAFDAGMEGIDKNEAEGNAVNDDGKYIVLTEKPSASNLESEDLGLEWDPTKDQWKLTGVTNMDAEGTYTVKVILDNGAYATATWEVKKFQTPVQLRVDYNTTTVELGGKIAPAQIVYVDANGVEKAAKDADFAATGYAIAYLANDNTITVKSDEKYVGATINVTVVSEKYDLVGTAVLTVADGAVAINFVDKAADVNVNNKLVWNVVDSTGTKVALDSNVVKTDISYVILDKPEGAKVSTYDATNTADLRNKGEGKVALTSNKVGNVAVQVILKAEYAPTNFETAQTKYYTGTQIIAVGTQGVGDVVVMSVGSNEIVINDAKATIDAAPIVENSRTFVPFRALAEAFGAEVAYDEATQSVTAELNGVTVVMTIGSAEYTVNGVVKTADVAPFINGSRTMVPVRFAAEAFGIKVIPTYDEKGATADILFNL